MLKNAVEAYREALKELTPEAPLPLVSVRVNGSDEVTFFIDTGGSKRSPGVHWNSTARLPHWSRKRPASSITCHHSWSEAPIGG